MLDEEKDHHVLSTLEYFELHTLEELREDIFLHCMEWVTNGRKKICDRLVSMDRLQGRLSGMRGT